MSAAIEHSFVILAYADSPHLEACVQSLLAQTRKSRVLIATSTPNEAIASLADKYSLDVFVNEIRGGMVSDWNFGYRLCETPFVTLAHQDDIYLETYTDSCLAETERRGNLSILFTDYGELDAQGNQIEGNLNLGIKKLILKAFFLGGRRVGSPWRKKFMLSLGSPIPCPSVLFNKAALGDFAFDPEWKINADWRAWLHIAQQPGEFAYLPRQGMLHRIHTHSETTRGLAENLRQQEDLRMFEMFWPYWLARLLSFFYGLSYHANH